MVFEVDERRNRRGGELGDEGMNGGLEEVVGG